MARRERRSKMSFGDLKNAVQDNGGFKADERIFKLKVGEDGTGTAIIRFLPAPDSEVPFTKIYEHGFKADNGYYIEACPTTIGKECPACKQNNIFWNNDQENEARSRKRKLSFYSNILVIKDDACPKRKGKIFLFRYGKKIHDKIIETIEGKVDEPFNPFDYYEGANFVLAQKMVGGFNNYDSSRFKDPTQIAKTEKEIDAIDEKLYDIKPFVSDDKFKTYNTLATLYKTKTGITPPSAEGEKEETPAPTPTQKAETAPKVESTKIDTTKATEGDSTARLKIFDKLKNRNKEG